MSRKSNRTRKPTNRLLGSEMLLSLPRTARPSSGVIGSPDASHSDGHFSEVEAAASDADCSDGVYETNAHDHSSNSVIVGEQVGDQSPIEWSPTPPRGQALEAQDESANEMDAEPSPKKSVTVVTHELYSNRVRRGTPEESRPSSPKVYSPIELSDDDFPVLPPSPKESKESLKPFALRSHVPVTLSQRLRPSVSPISLSPPRNLTSIVVNGRTYYASDDPDFTKLVSSPSSSQHHGGNLLSGVANTPTSHGHPHPSSTSSASADVSVGLQVDEDSFELCYPPEDPVVPTAVETFSRRLSVDEYDDMDIDLPADFRSIRALRTPSPDLPSNPLEGWSPTPRSQSTLGSLTRPGLFANSSTNPHISPSKLKRGMSPLKALSGASPSPPRSLLSSPSHSFSGTSTANTSPSKASAQGSPKSRGKDHVRFHPFKQSTPNHSVPSSLIAGTLPVKSPSKSSTAGKRYRDDIIRHALSDGQRSPSTPSAVANKRGVSSPHREFRNALIRDALGENDLSNGVNSSGTAIAQELNHPQEVPPFVDNNLGDTGVLNPAWIDRRFAESFRSVTNLPPVVIRPIADESITEDDDYLLYRDMVSGIIPSHEKCIRQVVNFIRCANVFNGARFDPTSPSAIACPTVNNKIHLVLAEDHFFNAVFLTVGRVNESYIFNPKSFLAKDKAVRYIRGLRIHGLMQESQRLFACFGSLIGSTKFGCPVSEGVIDFRSNQRFDSDVWKDDPDNLSPLEPVTPGKKRKLRMRFPHSSILTQATVPIFDGRGSFVASAAQLNQISSRTYPLYLDSQEEAPPDSIVCVGYTAHTWQSSGSSKAPPLCLSLGLQFVVVLALPPGYDGPAPPSSGSSGPFPKPIYNTPTRTKDFPGPPRRNHSRTQASSSRVSPEAARPLRVTRRNQADSEDESPYLSAGRLKEGYEYHEDLMATKSISRAS
ncbi:hypothetical protein HHX47_DHR1001903 [Lentinula edodes]|nr:hypothetical protein HHX47_DHR1001903 [Lentinula edodes]